MNRYFHVALLAVVLGACGKAEPEAPLPPGASAPQATPPPGADTAQVPAVGSASLKFTAPAAGSSHVRDVVDGRDWAAKVQLQVTGEDIASVEFFSGAEPLGTVTSSPWKLEALLLRDGEHMLRAEGMDANGNVVVRVTRAIMVEPPVEGGCTAALGALDLEFREAKPTKGVTDPVIVQPVIGGVTFRGWRASKPTAVLMACEFAKRVVELAGLAKELGIAEVLTMGVYNYRPMRNPTCIKRGNCKLSQHAFATALDIYGVRMAKSGELYTLDDKASEKHWVIDKAVGVCPGKPKSEGDRVLHSLACQAYAQRIFNVVLTPNYNTAHRNHIHGDETATWHGIRGEDLGIDPQIEGIDPEVNGLGD